MAALVLLLIAVGGNVAIGLLHITLPVFRVPGGLLLFLQALSLTFSGPGLSSISEGERHDAKRPGDIAVSLWFPAHCRTGALSAVMLLMGRTEGWVEGFGLIAMIAVCLGLTYSAMRAAERLVTVPGATGADARLYCTGQGEVVGRYLANRLSMRGRAADQVCHPIMPPPILLPHPARSPG
jgi:multiple antibiotic resistance protein